MPRLHRALWFAGWPLRFVLIGLIRIYRATVGPFLGGGCRFHPSCSSYAERAIREAGALRGTVLTVWRVARCSPLTKGGVDQPPTRSDQPFLYDALSHLRSRRHIESVIHQEAL
ncbi:MAG TPA: membrane protein insertion efficiency factor YidD [Actinomycetota bacterium]|nr:membrane protein insertion efficiency factor YidD [Actinomycetota bacterium]